MNVMGTSIHDEIEMGLGLGAVVDARENHMQEHYATSHRED